MSKFKVIIQDTGMFISAGIEAIIEDEVTTRFKTAQLQSWNFLSRSRATYNIRFFFFFRLFIYLKFLSWTLTIVWFVGFLIRYFFFFPIRFILFLLSGVLLIVGPAFVGCVPDQKYFLRLIFFYENIISKNNNFRLREEWNKYVMLMIMRISSRAFSAIVTFHNKFFFKYIL